MENSLSMLTGGFYMYRIYIVYDESLNQVHTAVDTLCVHFVCWYVNEYIYATFNFPMHIFCLNY